MATAIPTFASGKRSTIITAVESGKISYPAYVFCTDTNSLIFVNKNNELVDVRTVETENDFITVKTTNEWMSNFDYIPKNGEFVVYSDYKKVNENGETKNIPAMKIGDGVSSVRRLSFIDCAIQRLDYKLTIGDYVFDGSRDVSIPVYDGENI